MSNGEVARRFGVSTMTVRRDLQRLEQHGLIIRTHGGAVSKEVHAELPYRMKVAANIREKRCIAREAVADVRPGDRIVLDAGTTTFEVARLLKALERLTIITNDLLIAQELSACKHLEVYFAGGLIQPHLNCAIGSVTADFLSSLHVDWAFIGGSHIDIDTGVSTPLLDKARVKQAMMKAAVRAVLVADSSKFGRRSFAQVASLNEFYRVITDDALAPDQQEALRRRDVPLTTVSGLSSPF